MTVDFDAAKTPFCDGLSQNGEYSAAVALWMHRSKADEATFVCRYDPGQVGVRGPIVGVKNGKYNRAINSCCPRATQVFVEWSRGIRRKCHQIADAGVTVAVDDHATTLEV
jgi:hypothetical protein